VDDDNSDMSVWSFKYFHKRGGKSTVRAF